MRLTDERKLELISDAILPHMPVTMETTLDEIDFDSLDAASVAAMAEEQLEYGAVDVWASEVMRCRTVGDIVRLVWPRGR